MKRKAEIENQQFNGTFLPPNKTTVSSFLDDFVRTYGVNKWGVSMYDSNTAMIANYINPIIIVFVLHFAEVISQCCFSAHCINKMKLHCRKLKVCRNKVYTFLVVQNTDHRVIHRLIYYICEFRCKRDTQAVRILPTETGR